MTDDASGEKVTGGRDGLPLPDYDHLPLATLQHRVRTLDTAGLERLLSHERDHGDRLPVVQVLEARLDPLRAGAEPSGGSPHSDAVEAAPAPNRSSASSAASPDTSGPPVNPPSHGVPTNPAQPR